MHRSRFFLLLAIFGIFSFSGGIFAATPIPNALKVNLTLKHDYEHFTLNLGAASNQIFFRQKAPEETMLTGFQGNPFFAAENREAAAVITSGSEWELNQAELEIFLRESVAPRINRPVSNVTIGKDANGTITFDGYGAYGEELDIPTSIGIIKTAVENGIDKATLAVKRVEPTVTVTDPELEKMGIKEIVSIGKSNFSGSPANRRHNIQVGESKFNGVLIPQGSTFSFNEHLGPVNGATGYLKELVIVGPNTVPEYGGGLCQVSSTAYRGAMLAGLPIVARRNHSYVVQYYAPVGSDATIYPGSADLQFTNDSSGALLLQTRIEGDHLYYHYYGTKDERKTFVFGPYITNYRGAPATVRRTSTNIPVGSTQQLSGIHPGMDASWFRLVEKPKGAIEEVVGAGGNTAVAAEGEPETTEKTWQTFFSRYQARGLVIVTGVAAEAAPPSEGEAVLETVGGDTTGNPPAEVPNTL